MATSHVYRRVIGDNHITYRLVGSGPDVLLIHGWLSSGRMWEPLLAPLAAAYRVWAIDLIGFGDSRSSAPPRPLMVDDQVNMIAAFCNDLGLRPRAIAGHSMGGAITLKLALDYPDLFDRMVLVCPVVAGKLGWTLNDLLTTPAGKTVLGLTQYLWPTVRQARQLSSLVAPRYLDRDAARRSIEEFQKATWEASYGGLLSMLNIRLDQRLSEIDKPTLVVLGGRDLTVPPSEGRLAAQLIRGAQLVELNSCHHQLTDEQPALFHRLLEGFLSSGDSKFTYAA